MGKSDLVFESDKLEKRRKIRRIVIPIAVLLVIIAVIVVIALIQAKNKPQTFTGGEDTAYPYSWTENKDGSLTFFLPKSQAEGYDWQTDSSVPDVVKVASYDKAPENMNGYTVTPLSVGRTLFSFSLKNTSAEAPEEDQVFALELILDVVKENEKLKASVFSGASRDLPGVITGGVTEGYPYQIALTADRKVLISLQDGSPAQEVEDIDEVTAPLPSGYEDMTRPADTETNGMIVIEGNNLWECFSSAEEVARVNGVSTVGRQVSAELAFGLEAGSSEVRLYCDRIGKALLFTLKVKADGSVSISSDRIESYDPVPDETLEDGAQQEMVTVPARETNP